MLTKTYALRLYRLPRASQPLKRLQEPWSEKTAKDLPLPTPQRRSAKTALKWLASRVSARGPRIETFPLIPPNGPHWNNRLTRHPEGHHGVAVLPPGAVVVYCQGVLTAKGTPNGKARGAVAASLHVGNVLWGSTSINLGESVTKSDAQLAAFRPALALADDYLKSHQHEGSVFIFNSTKATVPRYADARTGPDQPTQLDIAWYTDLILRTHANISLRISWFKHEDAPAAYRNSILYSAFSNKKGWMDKPFTVLLAQNHQMENSILYSASSRKAGWTNPFAPKERDNYTQLRFPAPPHPPYSDSSQGTPSRANTWHAS
jgi:hypothetical protein